MTRSVSPRGKAWRRSCAESTTRSPVAPLAGKIALLTRAPGRSPRRGNIILGTRRSRSRRWRGAGPRSPARALDPPAQLPGLGLQVASGSRRARERGAAAFVAVGDAEPAGRAGPEIPKLRATCAPDGSPSPGDRDPVAADLLPIRSGHLLIRPAGGRGLKGQEATELGAVPLPLSFRSGERHLLAPYRPLLVAVVWVRGAV